MTLSHDQGLSHVLVHDLCNDQGPSYGLIPVISQDQPLDLVLAHEEMNYKTLMSAIYTYWIFKFSTSFSKNISREINDTAGLNGFDSTQIRSQKHEQLSIKAIIP